MPPPSILALLRQRQEDDEFKSRLRYRVRPSNQELEKQLGGLSSLPKVLGSFSRAKMECSSLGVGRRGGGILGSSVDKRACMRVGDHFRCFLKGSR